MSIHLTKDTEHIMSKRNNLERVLVSAIKIEKAVETLKDLEIYYEDSVFLNEYYLIWEILIPKYLTKQGVEYFYENIFPTLALSSVDEIMEDLDEYIK